MLLLRDLSPLPSLLLGGVAALGNFDGVHLGHQAVIARAMDHARAASVPLVVLTFEPHPREIFGTETEPFRLTPMRAKLEQFEALGANATLCLRFDREFASLTADQFIDLVLVQTLRSTHVVVGHDFCFGAKRSGNADLLIERGAASSFTVEVIPAQTAADGEPFSSTRIRDYLRQGEPERAARLLGRPFRIEGHVRSGDKRGRLLGFPTANLPLDGYMVPATGVYAVRITVGAERYDGVANLGRRPTFDATEMRLETHLFDYTGDLYGRLIAVDLIAYIRPERKFDGLDSLKAQIAQDSETARTLLRH